MSNDLAVTGWTLVPGEAAAPVVALSEPLSFWGGYDAETGLIIDRWHPETGQSLAGCILVMEAGRGSSSGSSVLAEALRRGTGPAGIVLATRDPIVTVGVMVAVELYGIACPVVLASPTDWPALTRASHLSIAADASGATLAVSCCPPGRRELRDDSR